MGIADECRAVLFIADYIGIDAGGKLNLIGAGWMVGAFDPTSGMSGPGSIAAMIDVPPKYIGDEFAVSFELRASSTDSAVLVPSKAGTTRHYGFSN